MDLDDRISHLVAATANGTMIEQELMRADVLVMGPHLTQNPGSSNPLAVVLDTHRSAFFKRFKDQKPRTCAAYKQEPFDVPLNEVIAWRLALMMGPPYSNLVPTSVLRKIEDAGGALTNARAGAVDYTAMHDARGQVTAAGFWDALIGNQDRNMRNFRYEAARKGVALIDHGFAFARPGDPINISFFFAYRRQQNQISVTPSERTALEALLDSGDLHGLTRFLAPDRAAALEARAQEMLRTGCLPVVGKF